MKNKPFTIIKDSREKNGYIFEPMKNRSHVCNGMVVRKLDTGDYSVEGLENKICIERKASITELANNIGVDGKRFNKEIERMKDFCHRFLILEFSLSDLMSFPHNCGIPREEISKVKISHKFILRFIMELQVEHGVNVIFCDDKEKAQDVVLSILKRINSKYSGEK